MHIKNILKDIMDKNLYMFNNIRNKKDNVVYMLNNFINDNILNVNELQI